METTTTSAEFSPTNQSCDIKLNTNVDTILTGIKRNSPIMNTEGDALINLNIPEHLKTSQKEN